MHKIFTALFLSSIMAFSVVGCKKTVEHQKVEHKNPDGSTSKEEHKVTTSPSGDVHETTERDLDR
jgi:hypothetical protein